MLVDSALYSIRKKEGKVSGNLYEELLFCGGVDAVPFDLEVECFWRDAEHLRGFGAVKIIFLQDKLDLHFFHRFERKKLPFFLW